MARNNGAGNDKVYRVVREFSNEYIQRWPAAGPRYFLAGPYTTVTPAKQERNKANKYRPTAESKIYISDAYIEEGTVTWERIED